MTNKIFQTDWLASQPIFYNELTGKVSHNINDVIDFSNFEFHPEGFNNYLNFGYSVLEQTPVKNVKFLRHSSKLIIHDDDKLEVEYLDDLAEKWMGKTSHEDDVFHSLYSSVHDWEKSVEGEIVIPTSGGYDSRLLNLMVEDKSRIRSFTFGKSDNQLDSFEVVRAQRLSEIIGTTWEHIPLGNLHLYIDKWDQLFGISKGIFGIHGIEFYKKILPKVNGNNPFLSGIIGGTWSGEVNIPEITSHLNVPLLGRSRGADSSMSLLHSDRSLLKNYYISNKHKLISLQFRVLESVRFKIILLSYLITVPNYLGFRAWSPFLVPEIALSMLTLPPKRRKKRLWQKEFFQKQGVDLESMKLPGIFRETLSHQAVEIIQLEPLNVQLLREVIKPAYVEWINRNIKPRGLLGKFMLNMYGTRTFKRALKKLGLKNISHFNKAYIAYLTLKPIEKLLKKRLCT